MKTKAEKHLILKKKRYTTRKPNNFIRNKKSLTYFQLKFNPSKADCTYIAADFTEFIQQFN